MLSKEQIEAMREDYRSHELDIAEVAADPNDQFRTWFSEALQADLREPNKMTFATANKEGRPSARTLLLKGFDEEGFIFYTNYESRKGRDLQENPFGAIVFCWLELERQVCIEGRVEQLSREDSLRYFNSRPKGSQIGAWVSAQSEVIANRLVLEEKQKALEEQYREADILPIPPYWGGYVLRPDKMEFWQGRSSRLHDRIRYTLEAGGTWRIDRLAP